MQPDHSEVQWNWFNFSGHMNKVLMKPQFPFPKGWPVLLIQVRSLQTWAKHLTFCVSLSTAGTAVNNLLWRSRTAPWGWRSSLPCIVTALQTQLGCHCQALQPPQVFRNYKNSTKLSNDSRAQRKWFTSCPGLFPSLKCKQKAMHYLV